MPSAQKSVILRLAFQSTPGFTIVNSPSLMQTLRIGSLIRDLNVTDSDSGLNGNIIFTLTAPVFNVPVMYFLFTVNLCSLPLIPTSQFFKDS